MDYRKIVYFLKVAETMNISRAAEQMNISHQGLSKQIHLLEEELGAALLERTQNGIELTEAGKKTNEWFRPIVNEAEYRYKQLQDFIQNKKDTVCLGYFNALSYPKCVLPTVNGLKELQKDLKVDVLATDVGNVRSLLLEDKIDLAISIMVDAGDWDMVRVRCLSEIPYKIIVSEKHPWADRESVDETDIAKGSLLYYDSGSPHFFRDMQVRERISCQNFDSYISRLEAGDVFGIVADIYSRREGNYRLLDLPACYRSNVQVIAAYRKEHPLRDMFEENHIFM